MLAKASRKGVGCESVYEKPALADVSLKTGK